MKRFYKGLGILLLTSQVLWADKIIMKDGKIYQGRIMGETSRSILIHPQNSDLKPFFVNALEVQTVVHDSQGPGPISPDAGRFAQFEALIIGTQFSSQKLGMGWAPGLTIGGGFRLHPLVEVGVGFDFWPALSGTVIVQDIQSQMARQYKSFYAYGGGFHMKLFPFFRHPLHRFEPYVIGGYHWNRLTPKESGDYFSGTSWLTGIGISWRWTQALALEGRILYQHIGYDKIRFQTGEGDITGVHQEGVQLGTGLSYRFL